MGIHIDIRIELTSTQKRIMRGAVVAAVVLASVLGVGLAIATPHQWSANNPLKAADLNGLNVLTTDAGTKYAVGATGYCGNTVPTQGDLSGLSGISNAGTGYAKAKAYCQQACGNSPSAHMCSADEMLRSVQAGIAVQPAWYSTAMVVGDMGTANYITDCDGWNHATEIANPGYAPFGAAWGVGANNSGWGYYDACNQSHPVACCDGAMP